MESFLRSQDVAMVVADGMGTPDPILFYDIIIIIPCYIILHYTIMFYQFYRWNRNPRPQPREIY